MMSADASRRSRPVMNIPVRGRSHQPESAVIRRTSSPV